MSLPAPSSVSDREGPRRAVQARPPLSGGPARNPTPAPPRPVELPPAHTVLTCVALPALAISTEQGQLTGRGLEGFYRAGRRTLSRCQLRVAGREPVAVQARMLSADSARFVAALRLPTDRGPDPEIVVERIRHADGTERITLHSSAARPLRLPVEISLGTDLADVGAVASGRAGPELPASVHDSGMRWSAATTHCVVTADPAPDDAMASAGLLRWEMDLPAGASRSVELRVRPEGAGPVRAAGHGGMRSVAGARAVGDDPQVQPLFDRSVEDLQALLLRDPEHPTDMYPAAGAPWRCGIAPAEALAAARMALPLGTRIAAGTLRTLARSQITGPGHRAGMIPGPLRDAGPHLPPSCTGTEATLLFPVLLAEAWRWGMPAQEVEELLPAARRCLRWLREAVDDGVFLADALPGARPGVRQAGHAPGAGQGTESGPGERGARPGGIARGEVQAHAHRAALLGADLLDAHGGGDTSDLRAWAARLRSAFREEFWVEDRTGGRPAAARLPDGRLVPHLTGSAAHLLDTGLLGSGTLAPGLLDKVKTEQLARLLGGPAMDSGWGLRSLRAKEAAYNPFGHRAGSVRVQETAVAITGLAAAGYEKEASALLHGMLSAAEFFDHRLPEMFAGEQRTAGGAPLPHPAACRPAGAAAAAGIHVLVALAGIRPDAPAGTVTLRPVRGAPLGELGLSGLSVAEAPFSVRVSRLGLAMVEEAADGLQLGV